jgi:hypothetical protein
MIGRGYRDLIAVLIEKRLSNIRITIRAEAIDWGKANADNIFQESA